MIHAVLLTSMPVISASVIITDSMAVIILEEEGRIMLHLLLAHHVIVPVLAQVVKPHWLDH